MRIDRVRCALNANWMRIQCAVRTGLKSIQLGDMSLISFSTAIHACYATVRLMVVISRLHCSYMLLLYFFFLPFFFFFLFFFYFSFFFFLSVLLTATCIHGVFNMFVAVFLLITTCLPAWDIRTSLYMYIDLHDIPLQRYGRLARHHVHLLGCF